MSAGENPCRERSGRADIRHRRQRTAEASKNKLIELMRRACRLLYVAMISRKPISSALFERERRAFHGAKRSIWPVAVVRHFIITSHKT
jgi:hypothetical protein